MPRKMRAEFPGAIYHVMSRGDRREAVFLDVTGPAGLYQNLGGGVSENRLAGACLLPDEQHPSGHV